MTASRGGAFRSLSLAIMRGFIRDKASVFFAVIFPLMFLVLFGGIFSDQDQPQIELIQVGDVSLIEQMPQDAAGAFAETFELTRSDDLGDAIEQVRKGDADVAVEERDDQIIAHYTQAEQVKAAIVQGTLRALVDGTNVALSGTPPTYSLSTERVEDDSLDTIQFVTPGLLGWAIAMSASFGAAATLNGWRNSKLLRRLQLAPVSTGTLVGAVAKTTEGAVNMANFLVLPMAFLSGSFFPLDAAPAWLQTVSKLLPLRWLNEGMLDVMVRGEPASAALLPMGVLAAFAIVVTLVAARLFRWESA